MNVFLKRLLCFHEWKSLKGTYSKYGIEWTCRKCGYKDFRYYMEDGEVAE